MTDTCHECCNVVTRLIEEANEERDILESKFKHYHKYKHVLISIKKHCRIIQYLKNKFKNDPIPIIGLCIIRETR